MQGLKAFLVANHGLPAGADEAAVTKMAGELIGSGKLSLAKYNELLTAKQVSPLEKLAELVGKSVDAAVEKRLGKVGATAVVDAPATDKAANLATGAGTQKDSEVQPGPLFNQAAAAASKDAGGVRVKRASEDYDSTNSRKVFPTKGLDGRASHHRLAGQDVVFEGRPAYEQSELERAYSGVWLKHRFNCARGIKNGLNDHDRDLLNELMEKGKWVGDYIDGNGLQYIHSPKALSEIQRKTYLEDSTSGGTNLVPYFFDVDLVTYPLLYGELFPDVDLRDLGVSNDVKTPTLSNLTISAGPAEGDTPGITLQTTSGLSAIIDSKIFNATGALTIGRDMLADTPIGLQDEFMKLYQVALLQWLDQAVAIGDGTTYPLGIMNTSGTKSASAANGTTGPWKVVDFENTTFALPKQYRGKNDKVVWLSSDAQYGRVRGVSVSSTDQRRIFGYDLDAYQFYNRPFKIQNGVSAASLAYGRIDKYRMWRRKGMELIVDESGRTLRLANELLITARSRWGGQVIDPNAWVLVTNCPLH